MTSTPDSPLPGVARWSSLLSQVQDGDAAATEELYDLLRVGIRVALYRQFGPQDLTDRLHDVFIALLQAVRRGELRDPECFPAYARVFLRRHSAHYVHSVVRQRQREAELPEDVRSEQPDPEALALIHEREKIAARALESLHARDREVLVRFYVAGESAASIQQDMGLTCRQFQQVKWRAKAGYAAVGRRLLAGR